jgi:putative DNA primase/helicase
MRIDFPPACLKNIGNPAIPLIITEGVRKADSAATAGLCCIDLLGVYNFRGKNEHGGLTALADWEEVALNDRQVYIAFDSDVMQIPEVHVALARLGIYLAAKKCKVRYVYLPQLPSGDKCGLDDFFTCGGTPEKLLLLAEDKPRLPEFPEIHNLTDLGNARRLVKYYGPSLRYCYRFGKWICWTAAKRWQIDDYGIVDRCAKDAAKKIHEEANEIAKVARTKEDRAWVDEIRAWAKKSEGERQIAAMIKLARSEPGIPIQPEHLDTHPFLLGVKNGIVNLETGDLLPPDSSRYLTKHSPVPYDPNAKCPRWDQFVLEIMGHNLEDAQPELVPFALVDFLKRAVGYSLTGSCRERCFFILHGAGKNGKSVFIETIRTLLGTYATKVQTDTILEKRYSGGPSNDIARLQGARFVCASESPEGQRLNETLIKDLTGQETISARFLFAEFFEFLPQFKIWLSTNHKPLIRQDDQAIWDRVRLIPFNVRFDGDRQDPDLPAKLREELPGILRWAVEGCLAWQRDGLNEPTEVHTATKDYREEQDIVAEFIAEKCFKSPIVQIGSTALYRAYSQWAKTSGIYPVSQHRFGSAIAQKFKKIKKHGVIFYLGIGIYSDQSEKEPHARANHQEWREP